MTMSIKTKEVYITFSTEVLVWAANNKLNLYCPVGKDDEILHQQAYWALEPHNSKDIDLNHNTCGFAFDENDEGCLEQPSHYLTLKLPKIATEYHILIEEEIVEQNTSALMTNGCDVEEAYQIALKHVAEPPGTLEYILSNLSQKGLDLKKKKKKKEKEVSNFNFTPEFIAEYKAKYGMTPKEREELEVAIANSIPRY
jgi:hypothetical protein